MKKNKATPYSKISIQSKRLVLRPYKLSDFKSCSLSHDGRLEPINIYDEPMKKCANGFEFFKEKVLKDKENAKIKRHYNFGIFDKESNSHIGSLDFMIIHPGLRWVNLGYHIQNQYFGHGYATEAIQLALKIAFNHLNFHRIEASMDVTNLASRAVAIKSGFTFEGKREKFFATKDCKDMWVYATNSIDYKKK